MINTQVLFFEKKLIIQFELIVEVRLAFFDGD